MCKTWGRIRIRGGIIFSPIHNTALKAWINAILLQSYTLYAVKSILSACAVSLRAVQRAGPETEGPLVSGPHQNIQNREVLKSIYILLPKNFDLTPLNPSSACQRYFRKNTLSGSDPKFQLSIISSCYSAFYRFLLHTTRT
jgi:hypothetical protein